MALPCMDCRKCGAHNPFSYFAPVVVAGFHSSCVCFDCAKSRGWVDPHTGDLKPGIEL